MKTSELQRYYTELTPFERSSMLMQEAVGRQRESEVEALQADITQDVLWTTNWSKNFFTLGSFAMFKSMYAQKSFFMLCHMLKDENIFEGTILELLYVSIGWLRALKRLAEETGAPFIEATKLLDSKYVEGELVVWEDIEIDESKQYEVLSQIWKASIEN